jgi:predicted enzyme related to lactoylglutathione lyase
MSSEEHPQENDMSNAHGRFVWYELMTTDREAAQAFYTDVLACGARKVPPPHSDYGLFTIADVPVGGVMTLPEEARRAGVVPHWIGYIGVDTVDATVERLKNRGGRVHVPPMDAPNVERFAIVADPQGATFALAKGSNRQRPSAFAEPGRVGWHELLAGNWEKAFSFYGDLFDWQKADAHNGVMGTYQQFSVAGETLGGMFTKPPTLPVPFWLYYFNTDDIEAAAGRVETGGGQIVYAPTQVPGGTVIMQCTDPQGAIFGLLDRRIRKAVGYFVAREPET